MKKYKVNVEIFVYTGESVNTSFKIIAQTMNEVLNIVERIATLGYKCMEYEIKNCNLIKQDGMYVQEERR